MLVIIHGWSDGHSSFRTLARRLVAAGLAEEGVAEIHLGDYLSLDDEITFADLVAALERAWSGVGGRNGALPRTPRSVDVVVHSTGALVIRDWLERHFAPAQVPVHRLLMLAPANFGSPLAHVGRSFFGRATKGWSGSRLFETGSQILKGLELASPYSVDLAQRDCFAAVPFYGCGGVLCTVLVGNSGYAGIRSMANRPGSDGTVRVATANLDCAHLAVDFATDPQRPTYTLSRAMGRTAFGVMDGEDHSSIACKERGPRRARTQEALIRALQVTDDDFDAWCDTLAAETAEVMAQHNRQGRRSHYHGYQNTVVKVSDQYGHHVGEYTLELYLNDDSGRRERRATQRIQEEVIANVHCYCDDSAYRSLLINCRNLARVMAADGDRLSISITASPDIASREVGYRTYTDDDIGFLSLSRSEVEQLFTQNRTLLVDLVLRREQSERVFRLRPF